MVFLFVVLLVSFGFGINLNEAMKIALKNSPYLKVWKERMEKFEGMKRSASAFPNPELRFESGFFTTTNGQGSAGRFLYLLEYSQEFPLWGVRSKRKRIVEELEKAFMNLYEAEKRKLLGRVYTNFYEALYFKERYEIAKKNYQLSKELEEFVEKAHKLGQASSLDLLRVKRERRLAQAKLKVEESLYLSKLKELGAMLGSDVRKVEGKMKSFPKIPRLNLPELPHIKLLKFKIRATEEEIKLFKALAKPQVGGGFVVEDSEEGYYGIRASLSVKVPLFYRNQGEILERSAEKRALLQEIRAKELELKAKLNSARERIKALKESLSEIEEKALPEAERELTLALKGYREGIVSLFELTDVKRRYYELLQERLNLLLELQRAYAELISVGGWKQ